MTILIKYIAEDVDMFIEQDVKYITFIDTEIEPNSCGIIDIGVVRKSFDYKD